MHFLALIKQKLPTVFLGFMAGASLMPFTSSASAADIEVEAPQVLSTATTVGSCAHQHVLSRLNYGFRHEVHNVPDVPQLTIKSMSNIAMNREEPAATKMNIDRQFCSASALMSDGTTYPVWYMIEFGQGFTGVGGFNLEFCVQGFDKWRIQDGNCRAVQ